eukprot:CAMPEP_0182422856 /NCGR_PEP_ID=MMETSP1167-20130531/8677_1 /TAXON_ID=2988 /ORGANISM="Mallomonas Sp, Strain CCMP3275" /LENGTH=435 /DNA_ID=CAMNT_0024601287 /DNA_START=62 /DNA_END=1365 /DNA_ORIENTATION=+
MAITISTTCRELAIQLCQLRNTQEQYKYNYRPEELSLVTTDDNGQVNCLLSPDVSVKRTLDKRSILNVLGWRQRQVEVDNGGGLRPVLPTSADPVLSQSAYIGNITDLGQLPSESNGTENSLSQDYLLKRKSIDSLGRPSKRSKAEMKQQFFPDPDELERLRVNRRLQPEGVHDSEWDTRYDLLLEYGRIRGNYNATKSVLCVMSDGTEVRLGKWLQRQRQAKKKNSLRKDRLLRLQSLVDTGKLAWALEKEGGGDSPEREGEEEEERERERKEGEREIKEEEIVEREKNDETEREIESKKETESVLVSEEREVCAGSCGERERETETETMVKQEEKKENERDITLETQIKEEKKEREKEEKIEREKEEIVNANAKSPLNSLPSSSLSTELAIAVTSLNLISESGNKEKHTLVHPVSVSVPSSISITTDTTTDTT